MLGKYRLQRLRGRRIVLYEIVRQRRLAASRRIQAEMKVHFALAAVLALLTPVAALDREAFTATYYNLSLRIEPAQQR